MSTEDSETGEGNSDEWLQKMKRDPGGYTVKVLLTDDFMAAHTVFSNFEDMVNASGIPRQPNEEHFDLWVWDDFVSRHSDFADFSRMVSEAIRQKQELEDS
jgi:hypothetical protein